MDAGDKNIKQGRQSRRFPAWIAVLFVFAHICEDAGAQDASVTPDVPSLDLVHSMTADVQVFPATRWALSNSVYQDGCVVQWSLTPFVHSSNQTLKVDSDISLKLVRSGKSGRWRTTSDYDTTSVSAGKSEAIVGAASTRKGDGVAELLIRFRTPQLSQLAAGKYHTTLTGTISGI